MAELILGVTDKEIELEEEVSRNAEKILKQINLDELLSDPHAYLNALGQAFLSDHLDEIEEGAIAGKEFAEKVMKKS